MSFPSPGLHADPATGQPERNVARYLADAARRSLQMLPCEPDTPEAQDARLHVMLALATALNPRSDAEIALAINIAVAQAHQVASYANLAVCRGDTQRTAQVHRQIASLGREARGWLAALDRLKRERRLLGDEAADAADADGRNALHRLTTAAATLGPPSPLPPPEPAPAAAARSARGAAPRVFPDPYVPDHKITYPPAPLPPSMAELAGSPDLEVSAETGPNAPPGYCEWEPGCHTPMWYTIHGDNLTETQLRLRRIWLQADKFCITNTGQAQLIRKHRGAPPDCAFELPSPDVIHVLLHDNSSNFRWADTQPPKRREIAEAPPPQPAAA